MAYFNTRDITAIVMCAVLWVVLNNTFAPIFWQITHMPFLCDFLAFTSLMLVAWWTRKFGAVSLTGLIVTMLTLALRSGSHMLGFMVASVVFDVLTRIIGYGNCFEKPLPSILNRDKDDVCPFEKRVAKIKNPEEAYRELKTLAAKSYI